MAAKCKKEKRKRKESAAALRRKCSACVLEFRMGMKLKHQTLYLYAVYGNAV
jgi:hypothetical protein